jgi:hypothetical protein
MTYVPDLDLGYAGLDIRYTYGDDRTFSLTITDKITGLPKDLTSYSFTSGVISPAISFTVSNSVPLTGVITVAISASGTTALVKNGKYSWYLKYTLSGKTRTYLEGQFLVV